jgi:hypothetical protein
LTVAVVAGVSRSGGRKRRNHPVIFATARNETCVSAHDRRARCTGAATGRGDRRASRASHRNDIERDRRHTSHEADGVCQPGHTMHRPRTGAIARWFGEEMVEFFEAENAWSLAKGILRPHRDTRRRAGSAGSTLGAGTSWSAARWSPTYWWGGDGNDCDTGRKRFVDRS